VTLLLTIAKLSCIKPCAFSGPLCICKLLPIREFTCIVGVHVSVKLCFLKIWVVEDNYIGLFEGFVPGLR